MSAGLFLRAMRENLFQAFLLDSEGPISPLDCCLQIIFRLCMSAYDPNFPLLRRH